MKLLDWLLAFFRIGVGEGEETEPAEEVEETTDELDVGDVESTEETEEVTEPEAEREQLNAAQRERERTERLERENAELRRAQPAKPAEQPDFLTAEERTKLADPKTEPLEKWQIESNRQLRQGRTEAQLALAQAHDVADRTSFATIAQTNPALYKKYSARVEERLTELRSRGTNAPRETILDYLVGKDMREGKFAKKKGKEAAPASAVARGKLPGARSDVGGKNAMSEHEKRAKRLENVAI